MSTARQQANVLVDLLRRERDALAEFLVARGSLRSRRATTARGGGVARPGTRTETRPNDRR